MPTPIYALERNGSLLLLKFLNADQPLTDAQKKVCAAAARQDDVTVLVVWGESEHRERAQVFSSGRATVPSVMAGGFAQCVLDWWTDTGRIR